LKTSNKNSGVVAINTRNGYKEENTKAEGVNWAYVVKTLIDYEEPGELNILADPEISLTQKRKELPFYNLYMRSVFNQETGEKEKKLYIGIESVYNRIQDLKGQDKIVTQKTKHIPTAIV